MDGAHLEQGGPFVPAAPFFRHHVFDVVTVQRRDGQKLDLQAREKRRGQGSGFGSAQEGKGLSLCVFVCLDDVLRMDVCVSMCVCVCVCMCVYVRGSEEG
jgi:hypothetical protein